MQPIRSECVFVQERSDAASVCPRPVSGSLIEAAQQSLARVRSTLSRLWCEDLILVTSRSVRTDLIYASALVRAQVFFFGALNVSACVRECLFAASELSVNE